MRRLMALCNTMLALMLCQQAGAATLADVIDRVRPAIVGVGTSYPPRQPIGGERADKLLGTGFVVADGHLVVTNYHVLPKKLDKDKDRL